MYHKNWPGISPSSYSPCLDIGKYRAQDFPKGGRVTVSDVVPLAVNDVGLENVASAQGVIWLDNKVAL